MSTMAGLPPLTIVPAGAGAGKTYTIQKTLSGWIRNGLVDPSKIVAVTFTKSAAAEVRGRIRAELVGESRMPEEALKLDNAYITTIHGFGQRIITEFAFDAGLSPLPRLLNEDEEEMLIRKALANSDAAAEIMQDLGAHGFSFGFNGKERSEAEEQFRGKMLGLIARLRSIGQEEEVEELARYTRQRITELYGETMQAEALTGELQRQVRALLQAFPDNLSACASGETPRKDLNTNYRDLKRALETDALQRDWKLWKRLMKLKTWKRKNPLPEGYNEKAEAVMAAALQLQRHPGPLEDAIAQAERFLIAAVESLEHYTRGKRERGLVDYTDMLAESYRLLTGNPAALGALLGRVDCLIIDEFQDTNPLQFSLLWTLAAAGVPVFAVGDVKQSIMGFQGADFRLLERLCELNRAATSPLACNYRSSSQLMAWINMVGSGLFSTYQPLEPKAQFQSQLVPVEVIDASKNLSPKAWASYVAARITALMDDASQLVYDAGLQKHRRLRGSDFAIIARSNLRMNPYADALRTSGIRCLLEDACWFGSREVQLAWYALSYVADPGDRHAAICLSVTELGQSSLEDALAALSQGVLPEDPLLALLDEVAATKGERSVTAVLSQVMHELDLYGVVAAWPGARQARANLLRLQEECRQFMDANREAMASGGYYGSDIKTFQAWLKGRVERNNDQPPEVVVDDNAVQIMTWHKAKGREWPVVVVAGLDTGIRHSLPYEGVVYEDFSDLGNLLEKARIEIVPGFDAEETAERFLEEFAWEREQDARSLLYVALTRAKEKVILEWPAYKKGKDLKKEPYWSLLVRAANMELTPEGMTIDGELFPCTTMHVDSQEPLELEKREEAGELPVFGRSCIEEGEVDPETLTPEYVTPSSLHSEESQVKGEREDIVYGKPLELDIEGIDDPMQRGSLLHRAFELLSGHPERASLLGQAIGNLLKEEQLQDLSRAVAAFDAWITQAFPGYTAQSEVPLLALNEQGSVIAGFADMVVETNDGLWIIDHKSDRVATPELKTERFTFYYPQLKAYADALQQARPDKPVRGIVVNWLSYGEVSRISYNRKMKIRWFSDF